MERILYDGREHIYPASLPSLRERTITVRSVSKEYGMIGWRVGWVVGPSSIVPDISRVSISNVVCQVGIGMPGAAAALDAADDGIIASVAEWQRRRDEILDELAGLPVIKPNGGWSLLVDVRQLGFSSREASKALLTQGQIAATAMVNWGTAQTDDYIRFVFTNEPVERLRGLRGRVEKGLPVVKPFSDRTEEIMRWVLIGIGAFLVLVGGVWLFQGIGILLGSVMTSQPFWAVAGAIVLVIGVVLVVTGLRRGTAGR